METDGAAEASSTRDATLPGGAFKPFVSPEQSPPELTFLPVAIGTALGIVFAFSSVYLSLKVGLTVSASIPVAVMSITLFHWLARAFRVRRATILRTTSPRPPARRGSRWPRAWLLRCRRCC